MSGLVLSLFPGIGLLDTAFEEEGFCVVRGPDVLWGGDVRRFHPPAGRFDGVIGGPPCQAFSSLAHLVRANGHEPKFGNLIPEYRRGGEIEQQLRPERYRRKAVLSDAREVPVAVGGSGKLKASKDGAPRRFTLADALRLQGLPEDFLEHAPFTVEAKVKAVANGVPLAMGRALARAVKRATLVGEAVPA